MSFHKNDLIPLMRQWKKQHHLSQGSLNPILLLSGLPGIGKGKAVHFLAQWILCSKQGLTSSSDQYTPCFECLSCQKLESQQHVDFIMIQPKEEEVNLKIDTFRELKNSQGWGAIEGIYKIIAILDIERMTPQAANSLLKLFEEPPVGWFFLMTTRDPALLLPTLFSRCHSVRLKQLSIPALLQLLEQSSVPPSRRTICAQLAQGSFDRAIQLAQNETWEKRKSFFQILVQPYSQFHPLIDWASSHVKNTEFLLEFIEQISADFLRWSVQRPIQNPEQYPWIQSDCATEIVLYFRKRFKGECFNSKEIKQAQDFWIQQVEATSNYKKYLSLPMNRKLIIQNILSPWLVTSVF